MSCPRRSRKSDALSPVTLSQGQPTSKVISDHMGFVILRVNDSIK